MRDHLDDLASDFSAIHRVDDILALDGPALFRLAWRISSYQGVMRDYAMAQVAEDQPGQQQAPPYSAPSRNVVGGSRAELESVPEFAGIFSFSEAS